MAVAIGALHPDDAPLPLRADGVCGVPVEHALGGREAVASLPLPAAIVHCRTNNADFRGAKSAHILHRNPLYFSRIWLLFVR